MRIFHITDPAIWESGFSDNKFIAPSLLSEGFIHCCKADQIDFVLDRWFSGKGELIIATLELGKIDSNVLFENSEEGQEPFPHIYGPINIAAVKSIKLITRKK